VTLSMEGAIGPLAAAGADLGGIPTRLAARFVVQEARVPAEAGLAITGTGEGELHAEGPLGRLAGGGRLAFARLTLAHRAAACGPRGSRPLVLDAVELPVRIAGPTLAIEPFAFRVGGGTVRGHAVLGFRGATPSVRLTDVRLQHVAGEPVLVDFLCQPYAIAGPLDASGELAFAGTGEDLRRSARGRWQVRAGPGRLVGPAMLGLLSRVVQAGTALYSVANLDVPSALFASPLEFDALAAEGDVEDDRLAVRQARLLSRYVRVTGHGGYGLGDTRLDFVFNVEAGRTPYVVRVGGTASQPTYNASGRSLLQGLSDVLTPLLRSRKGAAAPR
jgi:AsmA-like C-terminal region